MQVDFLLHLAEFRRRKAHEELGYPNIWSWCRRTLGLSEGSTFRRIHASILLKRFPEVEPYLRDGRLCMSRLVKLEKVLTSPVVNTTAVLFDEGSAEEIPVTPGTAQANAENDTSDCRLEGSDAAPGPEARAANPPVISELQPIAAERYLLRVAVGKEMVDEIDRAFDLLSHSISAGDLEGLLLRAVRGLVEREGKRKGALPVRSAKKTAQLITAVEPPTDAEIDAATTTGTSRGISMETRREVYARDGGCCAWPLAEGGVCGETRLVQFDHILALARGGRSTADNLRLTCAEHNAQHAREDFGDEFMETKIRSASISPARRPRPR